MSSNNPSEPLLVTWYSDETQCSVQSVHLTVYDCDVYGRTGSGSPFETALEFRIKFELEWTFPADDQFSHEPSIEVLDRDGQGGYLNLAEMRWRYSPDLLIDFSEIGLVLSDGMHSENGAWVKPGSTVSVSSSVYFSKSGDVPDGIFEVAVFTSGSSTIAQVVEGQFEGLLTMPDQSGNYPLSLSFVNLPSQARDVTSMLGLESPLIIVDGDGPNPEGFVSPREGVGLEISELENIQFEVSIKESVMIDSDSILLEWELVEVGSGDSELPIAEGTVPLSSHLGGLSGLIQMNAQLDLMSYIEDGDLMKDMELNVWITGNDMAGNSVVALENSPSNPLSTWVIESNKADFRVVEVTYSKTGTISIGSSVTVSIEVENTGMVSGSLNITSKEYYLDDEERVRLSYSLVELGAGESKVVYIDWEITKVGPQRIEISWDGESKSQGPIVQGKEESGSLLSGSLSTADPLYVVLFGILLLALIVVLFVAVKGRGYDESIWDDDEDWELEQENNQIETSNTRGPVQQGSGYENQPQYNQSDGYYNN